VHPSLAMRYGDRSAGSRKGAAAAQGAARSPETKNPAKAETFAGLTFTRCTDGGRGRNRTADTGIFNPL
jgi:hypothetical protein